MHVPAPWKYALPASMSPVRTSIGTRGVAVGGDQFDALVQEVREVHDLLAGQRAWCDADGLIAGPMPLPSRSRRTMTERIRSGPRSVPFAVLP